MLEWRRGYPRTPVHYDYDFVNDGYDDVNDDYDDVNDGYDYGDYVGDGDTDITGTSESGFLKFEKWKVKTKSFHSFSRSAKCKKNVFTLFREVKSERAG